MGTYIYTLRKTKPLRLLDLRDGSPTYRDILTAARWGFLYNGGSFNSRGDHIWEMHMDQAQERWEGWRDRPAFTVTNTESGGRVQTATDRAVWWDCEDYFGDTAGYLIDNPAASGRRGEPKLAIITAEQFHAKAQEATLRGAGLPSPVVTDQDAPLGKAYAEPDFDCDRGERVPGSWLLTYYTAPICSRRGGHSRFKVERDDKDQITPCIAQITGGDLDLTPLVLDAMRRERRMDVYTSNMLAWAESEQVLRRRAEKHLSDASRKASIRVQTRQQGLKDAGQAVQAASATVVSRSGTVCLQALTAATEAVQGASEALQKAEQGYREASRAYEAQQKAVKRSSGLLKGARNAFFRQRDEAETLRLALAHQDEPCFAFRVVEGAQWDYVHAAVELLREGGSFDSLGSHVTELKTGDFVCFFDEAKNPSRWVGVTAGSVWAKHFPHGTDAAVQNMALGLPEDQRDRAFKNLRKDPADLLRARAERKAANKARREAAQKGI